VAGEDAAAHPTWPGPGQLFVGTCYQPIDRSPEQIDQDIAIMKRAGFNVVRVGDLSWDSFEVYRRLNLVSSCTSFSTPGSLMNILLTVLSLKSHSFAKSATE
jgi:hypothetical protein